MSSTKQQKRSNHLPKVKLPTDKQLQSVYDVERNDTRKIDIRKLLESRILLEGMEDTRTEEYRSLKKYIEVNDIIVDQLEPEEFNYLIPTVNDCIGALDNEILNSDEDNPLGERVLGDMKILLEQLEIRDSEIKMEIIKEFRNRALVQRNRALKHDKTKIYNLARADAEKQIIDIFKLDNGELASMFSGDGGLLDCENGPVTPNRMYVSWPHIIRGWESNVIPLSPGIKTPMRYDHKEKKYKTHLFTMSSFFRDPRFVGKLNTYYNPLGLELTINQDKKYKNKWWFRISVTDPDRKIRFPHVGNFVDSMGLDNIGFENPFQE